MTKRAVTNTNMASEFWFFSQLHRLGYEAYITLGNTKAIDIKVCLNDKKFSALTFDVKGKRSFSQGSYPYICDYKKWRRMHGNKYHYFVFVGLKARKDKNNESKIIFEGEPQSNDPECFLIRADKLGQVAFQWSAKNKSHGKISKTCGFGFDPPILRYLKYRSESISEKLIQKFKNHHNIKGDIDFRKYKNIIITLKEFENRFWKFKLTSKRQRAGHNKASLKRGTK